MSKRKTQRKREKAGLVGKCQREKPQQKQEKAGLVGKCLRENPNKNQKMLIQLGENGIILHDAFQVREEIENNRRFQAY